MEVRLYVRIHFVGGVRVGGSLARDGAQRDVLYRVDEALVRSAIDGLESYFGLTPLYLNCHLSLYATGP